MPTPIDGRRVHFRDHLPEVFRLAESWEKSLLGCFLAPFEALFEELEAEIEGVPGGSLTLRVRSAAGTTVTADPFPTGPGPVPAGSAVTIPGRAARTLLASPIPAGEPAETTITVTDTAFAAALAAGDTLEVHAGGIPDLFGAETTRPPQFPYAEGSAAEHLAYLASWIALSLREDRPEAFNRPYLRFAIPRTARRSTVGEIDALLRRWLEGELWETTPPPVIVTDLGRRLNEVDTVFELPEFDNTGKLVSGRATLGVDTVLGEGPPHLFIVDLVTDPGNAELRAPAGLGAILRAARTLLDAEKPAHTRYQLRLRAHTMQLAPDGVTSGGPTEVFAQLGETTLLWDEPLVFDSDL